MKVPEVTIFPTPTLPDRKLYFDNNKVEDLMLRYRWTGCTDRNLRDEIMVNTEELIRQIIRAHNLHRIYPGQEESAFMDLFQTAWVQIERTLYKYKARVHCASCYNQIRPMDSCVYDPAHNQYEIITPEDIAELRLKCPQCRLVPSRVIYRGTSKIFNMWSQVARTVILAYIKKESRDYKNGDAYRSYLDHKRSPKTNEALQRFLTEARHICKYNKNYIAILEALEYISRTDERPYEGIIGKLVKLSSQSRAQVAGFLKMIRLRSNEFSDSPMNERTQRLRSVAAEDDGYVDSE